MHKSFTRKAIYQDFPGNEPACSGCLRRCSFLKAHWMQDSINGRVLDLSSFFCLG